MLHDELMKNMGGERGLPDKIISKLGYTIEDVDKIREVHVHTLEEFRSKPPEMVIIEAKRTQLLTFTDGYKVKFKKGGKYFLDLLSFIDGYKTKIFKPTDRFMKFFKFWKGEDLNNKKLLCWLYGGGIGDLIFVQPILRYIKEKYPKCILRLAHPARHNVFSKKWDFIDELYPTPMSETPFITSDYHLHFDGLIGKCKESETVNIYEILAKWANLDIPKEKLRPIQQLDETKMKNSIKFLSEKKIDKNFLILQLRASTVLRTPRLEFWLEMLNELVNNNIPVMFVDVPKVAGDIDEVIKKCDRPELVYNFSPYSKTIGDAMAMINFSNLVVAVDTGLIHIATALGKPVYGIYGPFPGKIRLGTYDKCYWVDTPCECAPCVTHGYTPCKNAVDGYPICYDKINIKELVNNIKILWEGIIYNEKNS